MNRVRRAAVVVAAMAWSIAAAAPVSAAGSGAVQIGGEGIANAVALCGESPVFPPMELTGDLVGCWYTDEFTGRAHPSGMYQETGAETFVGCLADGVTCGSFSTTYRFEAKFAPDGSEIHGRCQHPIVTGSGTGGFTGVSGRVDFKDVVETGQFFYRGHLKGLGATVTVAATAATSTSASSASGC